MPGLVPVHAVLFAVACATGVDLRIAGDRVDLKVRQAALADVLQCLGERTGAKVVYEDVTPPRRRVSLDLTGVTLTEAVQKLFDGSGLNYAMGTKGATLKMLLVSGGTAARTPRPGSPNADEPTSGVLEGDPPFGLEAPASEPAAAPAGPPSVPGAYPYPVELTRATTP
jgi:hypothetical protein